MLPTVPPSRPKIFFGIVIAYVIFLVAIGHWMPERFEAVSTVGFVVVIITLIVVEATAQSNDAKKTAPQDPDSQSR